MWIAREKVTRYEICFDRKVEKLGDTGAITLRTERWNFPQIFSMTKERLKCKPLRPQEQELCRADLAAVRNVNQLHTSKLQLTD